MKKDLGRDFDAQEGLLGEWLGLGHVSDVYTTVIANRNSNSAALFIQIGVVMCLFQGCCMLYTKTRINLDPKP